jgi:ATP synthase protein I
VRQTVIISRLLLPEVHAREIVRAHRVLPPLKTRPIRTVLRWQVIVTAVAAGIAGAVAGVPGAGSALLGGSVNLAAGVTYAFLLGLGLGSTPVPGAGTTLIALFRAEAGKVIVIVVGLWLALTAYAEVVPMAVIAAFMATVIVFSMAFFVNDREPGKQGDG